MAAARGLHRCARDQGQADVVSGARHCARRRVRAARPTLAASREIMDSGRRARIPGRSPSCERLKLLEQPLARGKEAELEGSTVRFPSPVRKPSVAVDLPSVRGRFDVVTSSSITAAGLPRGCSWRPNAPAGPQVMVRDDGRTSLSTAPRDPRQQCDIVISTPDLPCRRPRPGVEYSGGMVSSPPTSGVGQCGPRMTEERPWFGKPRGPPSFS